MTTLSLSSREFTGNVGAATLIEIPASCRHVFGSGAGSARATLDGVGAETLAAQHGWAVREDSNGFLCYTYVAVPVTFLRAAKRVSIYRGARPGGTIEYKGTGAGALRWVLRNWCPSAQDDELAWAAQANDPMERLERGARAFTGAYERVQKILWRRHEERTAATNAARRARIMDAIKIHFTTKSTALTFGESVVPGVRYKSGRVKTWIAYVPKAQASDTREDVFRWLRSVGHKVSPHGVVS